MKQFVILAAILWVSVCNSFAQENNPTMLSLRQCVEDALKNNVQLKQNELNIQTSEVALRQSKEAIYPNLNGTGTQGMNFGRSIDPTTNTFINQQITNNNFSISSNVTVFNWFRIMNTIRQNSYSREANRSDYKDYKNTVILNVVSAYIQVLFNKELLRNSQNQAKVSEEQMTRTQKLVRAGSLPESNYLDLKSKFASDQLAAVNAESQLNIAKLNLVQMMNLPVTDDIEGYDIEVPPIIMDTTDFQDGASAIYKIAEQNQPSIKTTEFRVKSSELGIKVAEASKYPRLSLAGNMYTLYSSASKKYVQGPGGTVQVVEYPFGEQLSNNVSQSLTLSLTVPIYNNYQARASVRNALIAKDNALLNHQNNKNQLRKKIEQAYVDARGAQKKYESAQSQLQYSEEAFRITEKRFNAGVSTAVDYTVSSNTHIKAQSDLLQAKYDLFLKTKILDFYKGNELIY